MAVINSVDDGIMKATKGAIRSAMLLLNKTKDYEFDVFRTLNGQVQINYYSSVEKPLEVYVSYCHFEVLFPDDEEKEYKKIDSVFNVITAYFEGANSV